METKSSVSSVLAVIFVVALVLAAMFGFGYYIKFYMAGPGLEIQKQERINERKSNEESQQYTETQIRGMRDQIMQYNANTATLAILRKDPIGNKDVIDAMVIQQRGIVTMVRTQSQTIPAENVPFDISAFLSGR